MTKWRVTFEVDLKDSIPAQEELKPHDYPLVAWASQAVFDLVLNHALVSAHMERMEAIAKNDKFSERQLPYIDRKIDACRQAAESMHVERSQARAPER